MPLTRIVCLVVTIGISFTDMSPIGFAQTDLEVTGPVISERAVPIESVTPVASDGHRGEVYIRKPPGTGPFPAVLMIPGGMVTIQSTALKEYILTSPLPSRFLAAGYAVAISNFRSRDVDLALEVASVRDVAAIAAEEPASMMFTGVFNRASKKNGERFTPLDATPIAENPQQYYGDVYQKLTSKKIETIRSPILILKGTRPAQRFNEVVLIPELQRAGKTVDVKTYEGEPHCFAFGAHADLPIRTPRPAVARQAFQDTDAFFRRHIKTQPTALRSELISSVPIGPR